MKIKVITDYKTHKHESEWQNTNLFCPLCGNKAIYQECGPGDYYEGSSYVCIKCNSKHSLDNSMEITYWDISGKQAIDQINLFLQGKK